MFYFKIYYVFVKFLFIIFVVLQVIINLKRNLSK